MGTDIYKALQVRGGAKWLTKCHMPGQLRGGATLLMNMDQEPSAWRWPSASALQV
jgi:hypothetical protein